MYINWFANEKGTHTHIDRGPIAGGLSKHPCILYMCLKSHGHVVEAWESFFFCFFWCHGCQILSCRAWGSPQWRTCTRYCTIDNAHARNSRWWGYWEDTSKDCLSKACSQHVLNVAFLMPFLMPFGPCAKVLAAAMQASPSNRVWMPNSVKHSGCASLDLVPRTSWVQCLQPSTMLPCLRFDAQFWTPSICEVVQNWSIIYVFFFIYIYIYLLYMRHQTLGKNASVMERGGWRGGEPRRTSAARTISSLRVLELGTYCGYSAMVTLGHIVQHRVATREVIDIDMIVLLCI